VDSGRGGGPLKAAQASPDGWSEDQAAQRREAWRSRMAEKQKAHADSVYADNAVADVDARRSTTRRQRAQDGKRRSSGRRKRPIVWNDLSHPMAYLNEDDIEDFAERMAETEDVSGEDDFDDEEMPTERERRKERPRQPPAQRQWVDPKEVAHRRRMKALNGARDVYVKMNDSRADDATASLADVEKAAQAQKVAYDRGRAWAEQFLERRREESAAKKEEALLAGAEAEAGERRKAARKQRRVADYC